METKLKVPCKMCKAGVCDWCKGKRRCGCVHHSIRQVLEKAEKDPE